MRWPTLTTPYKFTYVISQARLANEAKALSLGNAQVSLKMETPAEIVYLVEELTARTYGTLYQHVPASDPFIGVLHDTCALVGNSGSLMKHNYGDEIDEHNVVMRFNLAPTVGYEKHVGTKTTLRVSEMEYFPYRESSETILALIASERLVAKISSAERSSAADCSAKFARLSASAASSDASSTLPVGPEAAALRRLASMASTALVTGVIGVKPASCIEAAIAALSIASSPS